MFSKILSKYNYIFIFYLFLFLAAFGQIISSFHLKLPAAILGPTQWTQTLIKTLMLNQNANAKIFV